MHHDRYRLRAEGEGLMLQLATGDAWADMYWFTLEPHAAIDYEMANHFTSTHPSSRFLSGLMCALTTADGRVPLESMLNPCKGRFSATCCGPLWPASTSIVAGQPACSRLRRSKNLSP